MTPAQRKELWPKWRRLINMTPREIRSFLDTAQGKVAGLSRQQAKRQGIARGRDSGRALLRMLPTGGKSYAQAQKNWSAADWQWAKRQYAFNSRMRKASGPLFKDGKMTRKLTSLLIWGHDPRKSLHKSNPKKRAAFQRPIAFMRVRPLSKPKDLLEVYDQRKLVVQPKLDGFKVMAVKMTKGVILYSRRGVDVTKRVPHIVKRIDEHLKVGDVILGEMVYLDQKKKQDIHKLQSILGSRTQRRAVERFKKLGGRIEYAVYDLLAYRGKDITSLGLNKRKSQLNKMLPSRGIVHVVKDYPWKNRKQAIKDSLKAGGEGIVIKVEDSAYRYRSKGSSEPFGLWWKYKPIMDTADVILTKYKKAKEKYVFSAYQYDKKGKLVYVGGVSGMGKENEKVAKKKIDEGKKVLVEVSYQKPRLPSQKLRHMGWVRFRMDKPLRSATIETTPQSRKKRSKMRAKVRKKNPEYIAYVVEKTPKALYVKPFRSRDFIAPYRAANEFRLGIMGRLGTRTSDVYVLDGRGLGRMMRKTGLRARPMSISGRRKNPRNSLVKDALFAEAVSYRNFQDFSRAYWDDCARGIYWYATNEKAFEVGPVEKKLVADGKFYVSCNPQIALSGPRGEGKKYVVELDVTRLGSADFRIKRGSGGTEIRIVSGIERVKPMRILDAEQATRAWRWQKGLLPPSKDELFKVWKAAWKKEERKKEREEQRRERKREKLERKARRIAREERQVQEREAKEQKEEVKKRERKRKTEQKKRKTAERKEKERLKKEKRKTKKAAKKTTKKAAKKTAKKTSKKKAKKGRWVRPKPKAKKKTTALSKTNPQKGIRKVRATINRPGR